MDILALWNFRNPAESEERFREAIPYASEEEQLILATQIARTYGLRNDFETARSLLAEIEDRLTPATESKARYHLELGRTYCSTAHHAPDVSEDDRQRAKHEYLTSFETAKEAQMDYLAIDALHMIAAAEVELDNQIEGNERALEYMNQSSQPDAKKWEGSLRNNLGYALTLAGRYDDALKEFDLCLKARLDADNQSGARVARWMIGWTYRLKGDLDRALAIQVELERELDSIGERDPYVFDELAILYGLLDDRATASSIQEEAIEPNDPRNQN